MSLTSKLFGGDLLRRADEHLAAGDRSRAALAFAQGGDFQKASKLAAEMGDERHAVEWGLRSVLGAVPAGYEDATPEHAAELLFSTSHYAEALPLFELGRAWDRAGETAARLQQPARAARIYERGQLFELASSYYLRAKLYEDALRVLNKEAARLLHSGGSYSSALARLSEQRAEILRRLGRSEEAATMARGAAPTAGTGRILESVGQIEEAILSFIAAERFDEAVALLPRATRWGAAERGKALLDCRRFAEAAAAFAEARDFERAGRAAQQAGQPLVAARYWEQAELWSVAAEAFKMLQRWPDAARCFAAGGDHAGAAAAFRAAGDRRRAANAYLKAGDPYAASTSLFELGDKEGAALALRQVPPDSPNSRPATLKLLPILFDQGAYADALARLELLAANLTPRTDTDAAEEAERSYWHGRLLEQVGRGEEAVASYQRAALLRPQHTEATTRLATLATRSVRTGAAVAAPPSPSPTGAGTGPTLRGPITDQWIPGSLIAGRYEIQRELGRGGMGRVYQALDRELHDEIAIKTVLGGDESEHQRLLRELQICRRLTHPNIVRVFDLGRIDGGLFITMELVPGDALDVWRATQPRPSWSDLRLILRQVTAGLAEAHRHGVIHRDLKPGNVILAPSGQVKILDFGIARTTDATSALTVTGYAMGTPAYMSPEQLRGETPDGRSDLYALGVLAFTLIAGREPFTGSHPMAIVTAALHEPTPDLATLRPDVPGPWRDFVQVLLAKRASERFSNAAQALEALDRLPV